MLAHSNPSRTSTLALGAISAATLSLASLGSTGLTAQAPELRAPDATGRLSEPVILSEFVVPIHTRTEASGYGLWASAGGYKASFHDGFVFYPALGAAYPANLPLRWQTISVGCGSERRWAPATIRWSVCRPCSIRAST